VKLLPRLEVDTFHPTATPDGLSSSAVLDSPVERTLSEHGLEALLRALAQDGYTLIGPTLREGAISYAPIEGLDDMPRGVTEEQSAGHYRLRQTSQPSRFRFAATAHSFKRFFHPPEVRLFSLRKSEQGPVLIAPSRQTPKLALVGARACDIAALGVLDGVLGAASHPHPDYVTRRKDVIVIAVNCSLAGGTCFCRSAGTGPRVTRDFDVALSELLVDGAPQFLARAGSVTGERLLQRVPGRAARAEDQAAAEASSRACEAELDQRAVDLSRARESLQANPEHSHWQAVAERCLACGNCTAVCPTCFCTDRVESNDADGLPGQSEIWDSCFTADFSHLHGGAVRSSTRSRYRQWLSHKFSTWHDQFGSSGCVGCGRCITWCPVGIDVRAELMSLGAAGERPVPPAIEDGS
jgi:ferredoxin